MCGIMAYVGSRPAGPILIDGLRRLEYRGPRLIPPGAITEAPRPALLS